jgi:hypothetical protein
VDQTVALFCNPDIDVGETYHDTFHAFLTRQFGIGFPQNWRDFAVSYAVDQNMDATYQMLALKRWLQYIPRDQLFIINMETLLGIVFVN